MACYEELLRRDDALRHVSVWDVFLRDTSCCLLFIFGLCFDLLKRTLALDTISLPCLAARFILCTPLCYFLPSLLPLLHSGGTGWFIIIIDTTLAFCEPLSPFNDLLLAPSLASLSSPFLPALLSLLSCTSSFRPSLRLSGITLKEP